MIDVSAPVRRERPPGLLVLVGLAASLMLFAGPGCSPVDPRSRLESALATLGSDAGGSRKAEACAEIRTTLATYPNETAGRSALVDRAVPLLIRALGDPASRVAAYEALVSIGVPSHEALFDAVLDANAGIQEGAALCLIRMSNTAVPVLIPALLGDDWVAQDRATRVLTRLGEPVSPILREYYAKILEPFSGRAGADTATSPAAISVRGKSGVLAFARVLGSIGDETSVLALLEACEALRRSHPDLAAAHLRIIDGFGPDAITRMSAYQRREYDRLKLMVGSP